MPQISVKTLSGEDAGTIDLSDAVFGVKVNGPLMHQAVTRILGNQRAGTHKAKTRSEVTGSTVKVWRQKGTGRARQGSRKSPVWKGGGVAFPPQPRSYEARMPKKMRRQATRSALTSRLADDGIIVVSSLEPAEPRTRVMAEALGTIGANGKVLLIDEQLSDATVRSSRNLPGVEVKSAATLNIVDVLQYDALVFTADGIRLVERNLIDGDA